jgi:DNA-binding beta-propeller fold protein YncE
VLAISLDNYNITTVSNLDFDFPHGISVSEDGMVAVTNYGSSTVILFDANNVIL